MSTPQVPRYFPDPAPSKSRVFLAAAAGPVAAVAREAYAQALADGWADPTHLYAEGRRARALLDTARAQIADHLGARPDELSFTGSGSTARVLAIRGLLHGRRRVGHTLLSSAVEHSAVLQTAGWWAATSGSHRQLGVDGYGRVDPLEFASGLAESGCAAAVLQTANAEVGTRQPVDQVLASARAHRVPLVVDAGASLGWEAAPDFDALVADARSWGGPPGVGLLAIRTGVRWRSEGPALPADGGRVPGEVNLPAIVAAAAALTEALATQAERATLARDLTSELRALCAALPGLEVLGAPEDRLPHILTLSALYIAGEALVQELDRRGFAVASGSACTASTLEPSHVLAAMGALTHGNIRITLPLQPTVSGVRAFPAALAAALHTVRASLGVEHL